MKIVYAVSVIKKLKKINPADKNKIKKKIESLKTDPLVGKLLKGEFAGLRSLKVWPLRLIYSFDAQAKIIYLIAVDYRGQVYK